MTPAKGWRVTHNKECNCWEVRSGITVVASGIEWVEDAIKLAAAPELLEELRTSTMMLVEMQARIELWDLSLTGMDAGLQKRININRAVITDVQGAADAERVKP